MKPFDTLQNRRTSLRFQNIVRILFHHLRSLVMSSDITTFYDAGTTAHDARRDSAVCLCVEDDAQAAAIRAPLLAIASAFILLIQLIPIIDLRWDRQISACMVPASVVVAVVAGWHWLSAETSGAPGIYMISFSVVAAILTTAILAYPFYQTLKGLCRNAYRVIAVGDLPPSVGRSGTVRGPWGWRTGRS